MTILTEQSNPDTVDIDLMTGVKIAQMINNEDKKVALAIESQLAQIGKAIEQIARAFRSGGRLAYFGAGTSGRIGVLDASECPPTFGVESDLVQGYIAGGDRALRYSVENSEDSAELGTKDLAKFNPQPNDVIVGISASGNPLYVLSVLETAQKSGCVTIGITSNPDAALKKYSDIFICPVVGQEAITGSSRMKSGTAQKMILNMLSTGAMVLTGKTYKNYMIDLRLANKKLEQRGRRFVSEICKISTDEAAKYLALAENRVKTACVMAKLGCSKDQANKLLEEGNGILRKVIE